MTVEDAKRGFQHCSRGSQIPVEGSTFDEEGGELVLRTQGSGAPFISVAVQKKLCERLTIPFGYFQRCPVDLQCATLNSWREIREDHLQGWLGYVRGNTLWSIVPYEVPYISPHEALDCVVQAMGDGEKNVFDIQLGPEGTGFTVRTDALTTEPIVGDITQGGLTVSLPSCSVTPFTVRGYMYRLVCSNGLVTPSLVRTRVGHVQSRERALDKLEQIVEKTWHELSHQIEQYAHTVDVQLDAPEDVLRATLRDHEIPRPIREIVWDAWEEEKGDTMYHVLNAITRGANSVSLPLDRRDQLQRLGGELAVKGARCCPQCHHILS